MTAQQLAAIFAAKAAEHWEALKPYHGMQYDGFTLAGCNDLGILYWRKGCKLYTLATKHTRADLP